ncbi:MAG: hypothetical protein LBH54_01835 [Clostridiales bacterium]|nr:hypothetical protein [Clostridiales bacterium]
MTRTRVFTALAVVILLFPRAGAAYERRLYGAVVSQYGAANMESDRTHNYYFHNDAGFAAAHTEAERYSGKRSLEISYRSGTGLSALSYSVPSGVITDTIRRRALYFSYYIKGVYGGMSDRVAPLVVMRGGSGGDAAADASFRAEAAGGGWYKVYGSFPFARYDAHNFVDFMININRQSASDNTYDKIYIDDLSIHSAPVGLDIKGGDWRGAVMPLGAARPVGIDSDGVREVIEAADLVRYRVTAGDGRIEDGNLVYLGASVGTVTLEADFFGARCTFGVTFRPYGGIDISTAVERDGVYSVDVTNHTDTAAEILLAAALSDGGRLSRLYTGTASVAPGSTLTVSTPKVTVPFYVNAPEVKTFVFTNAARFFTGLLPRNAETEESR